MKIASTLVVALALAACASDSSQSESRAKGASKSAPLGGDHGIVVWSAGEDAWFADPRDKQLRVALDLVDARLSELTVELDEPEFPEAVLLFLSDVARHPLDFRAGFAPAGGQGIPIRAQLTVQHPDPAAAATMAERFAAMLERYNVPSLGKNDAMHGMMMVPLGPVSAYHGAPDAGGTFVIAVNDIESVPLEIGSLDLPSDVKPFFAAKVDYGMLARAAQMASGGQSNPVFAALSDMVIETAAGYGPDRMHQATRVRNWMGSLRGVSLAPSAPLKKKELEMIPVDAVWAAIGRSGISGVPNWIRTIASAQPNLQGVDPIEALATYTGFNVQKELFDHLGETWGVYASDTTGGGGLASAVGFVEVRHPAELEKSLDWLASVVGDMSETHARGYVAVRKSSDADGPRWSLVFPGLPVPLEAVFQLSNGYLFTGLSPQSVTAAVRQAAHPKKSLLDQSRFEEMASGDLDDLYSLSYLDTQRAAREGYAATAHLTAALANATRSKVDPARDAGAILPTYHELLDGAKAWVAMGRLDGDDLVTTSQGDRSLLANASAAVGCYQGIVAVAAMAGAIIPQVMEKKERAMKDAAGVQPDDVDPGMFEDETQGLEDRDTDGDMDDEPDTDEDSDEPHHDRHVQVDDRHVQVDFHTRGER